jgi:putative ABC transport system ATP-binding protein
MKNTIVRIQGLKKVFDNQTVALNGIDLKVRRGEWLTIMGPSGSGKTTLLNILGGLDKPTSGRININNIETTNLNNKAMTKFRRENIGFIFQQFHLVPYLTALENVLLAQYFHSIAVEEEAVAALARVGLADRLAHLPTQMSGGEQQRVAVARALANEPDILLADEPTGNLDSKNGRKVMALLQSLHDEGHTIIMITHEYKLAKYSERLVKIVDGMITSDESVGKSKSPNLKPKSNLKPNLKPKIKRKFK